MHSLLGLSLAVPDALGVPTVYTSHNYWPICPRMYLFREDLSLCDGPEPTGRSAAPASAGPSSRPRTRGGSRRGRDRSAATSRSRSGSRTSSSPPGTTPRRSTSATSSRRPSAGSGNRRARGANRPPGSGGRCASASSAASTRTRARTSSSWPRSSSTASRCTSSAPAPARTSTACTPRTRAGRVVFHGGYEPTQLPELLASVDVVCVPSLWEDCAPLTVAEALAARAPVVGAAIGGIPEFFADGVDGLAVPHGDPAALAAALRRFVDDRELLGRMQAAIAAPRGFDAYLDELESHYRAAIAAADARRPSRSRARARSRCSRSPTSSRPSPELLAAWGRSVGAGDDVTLVIDGSGSSEQELVELLGPAIAAADLERDDAADLLAVAGGDRSTLARSAVAVLSRRPPTTELERLPHFDESGLAELRTLLDTAPAATRRAA